MARIFDRISEISMRWYDSLSDRERRLLTVIFAVVLLLIIVLTLIVSISGISEKRDNLKRNKEQLALVKELEGEYLKAKEKNDRAMMSVRRNSVSLFTYIQTITTRLGLAPKDLNEQKKPMPKSNMVEISVRVNLAKLSIDKLTALIEAITTSEEGQLVKITRLKVTKRFDEPDLLDLQMTVSTWKSA